ncbi:hypothetical protein HID58_039490, partial [Brassica napus]
RNLNKSERKKRKALRPEMLPLKLARSLLLHETLNLTHNSGEPNEVDGGEGETSIREILSSQSKTRSRSKNTRKNPKTPLLFFVPSRELISETYRLASIARDLGMDLYPTPSLSHIIFSFPPRESGSAPSPFSTSSSRPSTCWSSSAASMSSSLSWSLPNDAVMLSFPSLSVSSISHLRSFVSLSNGLFKLVFSPAAVDTPSSSSVSNWDCCSGNGGSCRVRELRLPQLDFENAPLRILQYLMLMTDHLFFLA